MIVPVTDGKLDLGPWQAIFYAEFDGGRDKRLVIKVLASDERRANVNGGWVGPGFEPPPGSHPMRR